MKWTICFERFIANQPWIRETIILQKNHVLEEKQKNIFKKKVFSGKKICQKNLMWSVVVDHECH